MLCFTSDIMQPSCHISLFLLDLQSRNILIRALPSILPLLPKVSALSALLQTLLKARGTGERRGIYQQNASFAQHISGE